MVAPAGRAGIPVQTLRVAQAVARRAFVHKALALVGRGLLAGAVMVIRARSSTQVEIAASMELAQLLVSEAVNPDAAGGAGREISR